MGLEPAQVTFHPRLTVVYGASDTGKSFVTEAIDYMLGARKLNVIPEAERYSQILLGVVLPDGSVITLVRGLRSTIIKVYRSDVRDVVHHSPDLVLAAQHSTKGSANLSRFLLSQIGLDNTLISTNDRGNTKLLAFRDLLHLCLVSETRMVSPVPPALRAAGTNGQTAYRSALKLMLTGAGEPPTATGPNPAQRRVHKGKITLLDGLIIDLQRQLTNDSNQRDLEQQLARLIATLNSRSSALREVADRQVEAVAQRTTLSVTLAQYDERLAEIDSLLGRFGLLRSQYESDLARLAMVNEAGSLLGYFTTGACVFCGAEPEHQRPTHSEQETTALHAAVDAESTKTRHLLGDLLLTIDGLRVQRDELAQLRDNHRAQAETVTGEITRITEEELRPLEAETAELMAKRSEIERDLGLHERIEELETVKQSLVAEGAVPGGRPSGSIPARVIVGFERAIQHALEVWRVRFTGEVDYDQYTAEMSVGGKTRAGHGKGMRAVLNAAFTVALADLCLSQEHSHPGFIVLDSPLVTYREPGTRDAALPDSVKDYFYRGLLHNFAGQAIVVENGDPPADITEEAEVYMFSRERDGQRFGFFPTEAAAGQ
ncbi:hypothetical protein ACIQI7_10380 [Kitasatospora sp. NPDC092039]|uniref:hypothetical protein n=1 Tax=Kitasatospora sp. NPDC092039 TaxID=3364086 RepID=UPI00382EB6B9